jgi:toxin HigB-1
MGFMPNQSGKRGQAEINMLCVAQLFIAVTVRCVVHNIMIKSFADKITTQLFEGLAVKRMDAGLQKQALRRLRYLDAATQLDDLKAPPSNRLEALLGDRKGFYSIRVNDQWRIIFRWVDGNAFDVAFLDYH